jgi:hypothetical protein
MQYLDILTQEATQIQENGLQSIQEDFHQKAK